MKKVFLLLSSIILLFLPVFVSGGMLMNETFENGTVTAWNNYSGNSPIVINTTNPLFGSGSGWVRAAGGSTYTYIEFANPTVENVTCKFEIEHVDGTEWVTIGDTDAPIQGGDVHRPECSGGTWRYYDGAYKTLTESCAAGKRWNLTIVIFNGGGNVNYYFNGTKRNGDALPNGALKNISRIGIGSKVVGDGGLFDNVCCCLGTHNTTCCDAAAGPPPPPPTNTINLSVPNPPSGSLYNTLPIIFNVTGNFTYHHTNCSLYINDSINITVFNVSNGTNIFVNFTLINVSEGNITWFIGCIDNTSEENTSLSWFTYDVTLPIIVDDFVNNTLIFETSNLSAQFNFTDNLLLHTLNVTVDGVVIFNVTPIGANNYSYNLSYNASNLGVGDHELVVKIADGHTKDFLLSGDDYNPSNGLFNDYIKYSFRGFYDEMYVKTELKESSLLDDWSAEQKFDRYTETLIPYKPNISQTFIVSSDKPIYIASVPGFFGDEWLIIGDHWKDFVLKDEPNSKVSINQINDYMVEVVVTGIKNNPGRLVFDSVGDLNIVNVTYNFVRVNMTETYTSIVLSNFETRYTLDVDLGLLLDITGLNANALLDFNGTNMSATLLSFDNTSANFTINVSVMAVNYSENITHKWYFNLTNLTNPPLFTLDQDQQVYNVSVGVCVDPVNHTIVNFSYYDEISLNRTNLTNTYDLTIYDGTFYYNQTNNTFPRNISNRLCTNIDPAITTYNWDMWGSFILSEPTYITRVIDIESAAPIPISNNPYSNVSFFIIKVANSSTVTFTWLTESFQLIDGTMRIYRCGVNGSRNLVASTSVISGAATVNLELLTAVYSYDIIIGGLIFSDLGGYSKCHVESQTSITYFVDIGGVDVTPIIGLNGIPCLLNRTNDDVVNMIWAANPEDSDYVVGCIGAYVNNIYGSSLIQENCSNETDGYSFEVNFSILGLTDYVVVGELRQSGLISSCDNEIPFKTSTPAQETAGITFLIAAFFIVAAMILMFAGDGEIQLVGGIAGLIGVSVLGLLKFSVSVIVSLIIFLLLILVIGRATRRRT